MVCEFQSPVIISWGLVETRTIGGGGLWPICTPRATMILNAGVAVCGICAVTRLVS